MVDHTMPDEEEERCILVTILALRNVGGGSSSSSLSHDSSSSSRRRRRRRYYDGEDDDGNNSADDDVTEDKTNKNKNGIVMMNSSDSNSPTTFLPDAVIHHGILSYRPFSSFRVVLIRGNDGDGNINMNSDDNCRVGGGRKDNNNCYTLIFRSNRGNIRFRVTELPYLPPCRRQRSNSNSNSNSNSSISSSSMVEDQDSTNHNDHDDDNMIYQNADGIIISCYLTKFFEYCDYYGYAYASSSIVNDVTARIAAVTASTEGVAAPIEEDETRERGQSKKTTPTVVLCGNDIDVTHSDAKVSSVVFTNTTTMNTTGTTTEGVEADPQLLSSSLTLSTIGTINDTMCRSSFIDIPRHPFASLVRNITNDQGLEFLVVTDDNDNDRKEENTAILVDNDNDNNYDLVMNDSTCTTTCTCMGIMEDVEMIEADTT
eukprot:CAMPEP_0170805224 /NCGR_PEP_ID=MMETSP0733-20121128/31249_1 /TAXON_ID=186038 /ORGANISM="Fragilariopsis kerguelensis, Strain L26-C5" /LENGTH=428 /DNA_ID=CAMNT_0011159577 /DNA_START=23 /DNA_END=1305 /DNA_ORIENTATION=+